MESGKILDTVAIECDTYIIVYSSMDVVCVCESVVCVQYVLVFVLA